MASNIKHFYGCICLPYMIFCEVFVFLFFKLKKHYFWLHQALVAAHGIFLFVCGLLSVVAWALNFAGSVVSVHGLSCPEASSILFPPPGTETVSSSLKSRFLTTRLPGKFLSSVFKLGCLFSYHWALRGFFFFLIYMSSYRDFVIYVICKKLPVVCILSLYFLYCHF